MAVFLPICGRMLARFASGGKYRAGLDAAPRCSYRRGVKIIRGGKMKRFTALLLSTLVAAPIATSAGAATTDILIGLDEKITYDANGQVNGPPGKDAVLVMSIANPTQPRIRASLPLMNSLLGPPTNL